jgi:hypothetical protein
MRLNKKIREDIVFAALNSTFKERTAALEEERSIFADEVYFFSVGDHLKTINEMPEGFFSYQKKIEVIFGEEGNYTVPLIMSESRRIPSILSCYTSSSQRITDKKIIEKRHIFKKKSDQLEIDRNNLKRTLNGVVSSVSSVNKLQEIWPESTQFIPAEVRQKEYLPAVIAADLNNMINKMREAV